MCENVTNLLQGSVVVSSVLDIKCSFSVVVPVIFAVVMKYNKS